MWEATCPVGPPLFFGNTAKLTKSISRCVLCGCLKLSLGSSQAPPQGSSFPPLLICHTFTPTPRTGPESPSLVGRPSHSCFLLGWKDSFPLSYRERAHSWPLNSGWLLLSAGPRPQTPPLACPASPWAFSPLPAPAPHQVSHLSPRRLLLVKPSSSVHCQLLPELIFHPAGTLLKTQIGPAPLGSLPGVLGRAPAALLPL